MRRVIAIPRIIPIAHPEAVRIENAMVYHKIAV